MNGATATKVSAAGSTIARGVPLYLRQRWHHTVIRNNVSSTTPPQYTSTDARQAAHGSTANSAATHERARTIGLVYDTPNTHNVVSVQQGLVAACGQAGWGVQIYPCNASARGIGDDIVALARRWRLAGLVLAPPISENRRIVAALEALGTPTARLVSADQAPNDPLCAYIADKKAAYAVAKHLLQLGHRRIGFIAGTYTHGSTVERHRGYAAALADYGVALDSKQVIAGDFAFDDGFRAARKLFTLNPRPTAIIGCNDELAVGVLAAARATGINVPYDLSIAGFEDSPISRQCWPALTTARIMFATAARCVAERLIARLHGDALAGGARCFSPKLVVRGSTAPPPHDEPAATGAWMDGPTR